MEPKLSRKRIEIIKADIVTLDVQCIVNAANESLLGGGGVDGAIHRAAGPKLLQECRQTGGCPTGEVRMTAGHELLADYIIHAVGPQWSGGEQGEAQLLASCYEKALQLARKMHLESIAFPAISCGVYGYPLAEACQIAWNTIQGFTISEKKLQKTISNEHY